MCADLESKRVREQVNLNFHGTSITHFVHMFSVHFLGVKGNLFAAFSRGDFDPNIFGTDWHRDAWGASECIVVGKDPTREGFSGIVANIDGDALGGFGAQSHFEFVDRERLEGGGFVFSVVAIVEDLEGAAADGEFIQTVFLFGV